MRAHRLAYAVSCAMLAGPCVALFGSPGTATADAARRPSDRGVERFGVDGVGANATVISELGDGWSGLNGLNWQAIEPRLSRGGSLSYNWQRLDDIVRRFQPTGRKLQVNFKPHHETGVDFSRDSKVIHPGGKQISALVRIKPEYLSNWRMVVQALVERYDHDGNADMPGLKYPIITHIQVDSEPENVWAGAAGYTEALCAAYEAAKKANPEARIMAAGFNIGGGSVFLSLSPEQQRLRMAQSSAQVRRKEAFLTEFLVADASRCYDILSLHLSREPETIPGVVEWFNDQMRAHGFQKPIWSDDTMSGPQLSGRNASEEERRKLKGLEQNDPAVVGWFEQEQAAYLVKKAVTAFGEGVEKVFVSTDHDLTDYYLAAWRHMGLLDRGGRRKPAFTAFKTMVEQLDGFTSARRIAGEDGADARRRIETGEGGAEVPRRIGGAGDRAGVRRARRPPQPDGGQLHAFEFAREGRKIVVAWNDGEGAVDLTRYLGSRSVELVDLTGQRSTVRTDSVRLGSPVFLHVD